jgi:hypothetical protein
MGMKKLQEELSRFLQGKWANTTAFPFRIIGSRNMTFFVQVSRGFERIRVLIVNTSSVASLSTERMQNISRVLVTEECSTYKTTSALCFCISI